MATTSLSHVPAVLPAAIHAYANRHRVGRGAETARRRREGDDRVKLTFDRALAPSAADPARYASSPNLFIQAARCSTGPRRCC